MNKNFVFKKLINEKKFVIFLCSILLVYGSVAEEFCETSPDNPEVKYIIHLVKTQLNINSLQCSYTATSNVLPEWFEYLGKFNNVNIHNRNVLGQYNYQRDLIQKFDKFIWQKGNYYKSFTYTFSHIEKTQTNNDTKQEARTLLEVLSSRLNNRYKLTPEEELLDNTFIHHYYYYNNTLKSRVHSYDTKLKRYVLEQMDRDNQDGFSYYPDPRICLGYCRETQSFTTRELSFKPIYLIEHLEKEGKFYYEDRDRHRILWHIAISEEKKVPIPKGVEIWLDKNDNIVKLAVNVYPSRVLQKSRLEEILGKANIDCNNPCITFSEYEYSNFKELGNGIKIPLKVKHIKNVIPWDINPLIFKIIKEYKQNNRDYFEKNGYYNEAELLAVITKYPDTIVPYIVEELFIDPESVKINESIQEETFIAPDYEIPFGPYKEVKEAYQNLYKKELSKQKSPIEKTTKIPIPTLLFIIGAIGITLLGIFITKRYFGWGI